MPINFSRISIRILFFGIIALKRFKLIVYLVHLVLFCKIGSKTFNIIIKLWIKWSYCSLFIVYTRGVNICIRLLTSGCKGVSGSERPYESRPEGRRHPPLLQGGPVGAAEEVVAPDVSVHAQPLLGLPHKQLQQNI